MTAPKHYLKFTDLSCDEINYLIDRAQILKRRQQQGELYRPLQGKIMSMIFEKSSTRTRVSFEAGMAQLGGHALFLDSQTSQLGRGEPVEDTARVLSRMSDVIMIRTFEQSTVERLAAYSRVPVINGLTNQYHPCQILADIMTWCEQRGTLRGKTVAWIGDGNNMARTWLDAAQVLGFTLKIASPPAYALDLLGQAHPGPKVLQMYSNPLDAARDADIVCTDVAVSMGFEAEQQARLAAFKDYIVDEHVMQAAKTDAMFLHCLPAHRGEEVAAAVIDGPQSAVWDEAENRLHVQKALVEYLLLGRVEA